jgi:hypothetical protein
MQSKLIFPTILKAIAAGLYPLSVIQTAFACESRIAEFNNLCKLFEIPNEEIVMKAKIKAAELAKTSSFLSYTEVLFELIKKLERAIKAGETDLHKINGEVNWDEFIGDSDRF